MRQGRTHVRLRLAIELLLITVAGSEAEWPYDDEDLGRRSRSAPVELGARIGYDYDGDTISGGAQLRIPLGRRSRFVLVPSGDAFNGGDGADWQVNLDLLMSPGPRGGLYAGLGFGWSEEDGERERAVNQVVGVRVPFGRGRVRSYVEGRWTELNRDNVFRLVAGLNVALFRY